jgi:NNP family nitrate/nitrite transporter-like MFS transporter
MRVPMGLLTDRYGARRVFPALMAYTALPLLAIAVWHASYVTLVACCSLGGT